MAAARTSASAVLKHLPSCIIRVTDAVVETAHRCRVKTTDGRSFLDFSSGIGVLSTGHCHPAVVQAVQHQAGAVTHAQQNVFASSTVLEELISRLNDVVPEGLNSYFFVSSGSEAVDNAVKIARAHTGRSNIVAFTGGGFHGRTIGAMSITSSKVSYKQGFSPLMSGCYFSEFPGCLHCSSRRASARASGDETPHYSPYPDMSTNAWGARTCCGNAIDSLKMLLKQQSAPEDTAAIIVEPMLGEGGILTPPPGFLDSLRKITKEYGIMLVFDEVQSGVARTGKMWAYEHFITEKFSPDMLVFAKGIASGYPFAGLATRPELFANLAPGTLGGTYGGNAVCAAAAVATLDVIKAEGLIQNAQERGLQLAEGLCALLERFPSIIDVRGRGLMIGLELDPGCGHKSAALVEACAKNGLLVLTTGPLQAVRFLPPLVATADDVVKCLGIFERSLEEVFA